MRTIYKYPIEITDSQFITIKKNAGSRPKIVHVGLDSNGIPCIWIELFRGDCEEHIEICIVGTGHQILAHLDHVGSFVQGPFVWHVYS